MRKMMVIPLLIAAMLLASCAGPAEEAMPEKDIATKKGTGIYSLTDMAADEILCMDDPYDNVITEKPLSQRSAMLYSDDDITTPGVKDAERQVELYFYDESASVPYMELSDLASIFAGIYQKYATYSLIAEHDGSNFYIANGTEDVAIFNTDNNTVIISDWGALISGEGDDIKFDVVHVGSKSEDGEILKHTLINENESESIIVDLNAYGIHLAVYDDKCYVPVQTFNDLFLCQTGFNLTCNGKDMFILYGNSSLLNDGQLTEFGELYYSEKKKERPQELVRFTYNELCMALDCMYGLKEQHDITTFNSYFIQTGISEYLRSSDPDEFYEGLQLLTTCYFADGHSNFLAPSPYAGVPEDSLDPLLWNERVQNVYGLRMSTKYEYATARIEVMEALAPPAYEEYGDTAFITFDQFLADSSKDYYEIEPANDALDTISLLLYADEQIRRENSPIKNVVVDLSLNGGGVADAAAALIAWFSRQGYISMDNTLTGAKSSIAYQFDSNRNHKFELEDALCENYNLFCITSPVSFSCGNLCPAAFKASGNVTLLGKTTGGGACVIQKMSTACGCVLQISGNNRISTMKNGSYYDVDKGVEPDVCIPDINKFYDREYICDLIHNY